MGLKAIKGAAHRKRAHLYPGQQTGNIKNACWDRSHGQGPPPDMGTPPELGPPIPPELGPPLEFGPHPPE